MQYLLDTSVFSQPLRLKCVEGALQRWKAIGDKNCLVSSTTIAEVEFGLWIEDREQRWAKYRFLLENRLQILQTTEEVWHSFAKMKARQRALGQPIEDLDLLIAATASANGLTIATLNSTDFSRIEGISWEDWSI